MATPEQTQSTIWYWIVAIMLALWLNQMIQQQLQLVLLLALGARG